MELKDLYGRIEGDYEGTIGRLHKEDLVKKFVKKFTDDKSFSLLVESLEKNDMEEAFRAVHTLKGVAVNLGFTKLYQVSSDMTERLRAKIYDGLDPYMNNVREEYEKTIQVVEEFKAEEN